MQYFGLSDCMERNELLPFLFEQSGKGFAEARLWFRNPRRNCQADEDEENFDVMAENILFRLNLYARKHLPNGVSESKYALLLLLSSGCPAGLLARQVRTSPQKVSLYRRETMAQLKMSPSPISFFRG